MRFEPYIESPKERFEQAYWVRLEAMRHYVRCRQTTAAPNQVLSVWLRGPRCADCQASDPFESTATPAISGANWEEDVGIEVDDDLVREIQQTLAAGGDPAWTCVRCQRDLRPWDGDDVYVMRKHLEEDHSLPSETGPKRTPSEAMRSLVHELYDHKCFGCGVTSATAKLTIDHIIPQSRGGDAAFRNLQPLCEECQQKKADQSGEEIEIHDNMYFRPAPGDSYDGLFW